MQVWGYPITLCLTGVRMHFVRLDRGNNTRYYGEETARLHRPILCRYVVGAKQLIALTCVCSCAYTDMHGSLVTLKTLMHTDLCKLDFIN
jgi:hypothetical protein